MKMLRPEAHPLHGPAEATDISRFTGQQVRAVAGIGNPQRFFDMLTRFGMLVEPHAFPDHHPFQEQDLRFDHDKPLLITEKDAVKCRRIIDGDAWVISVQAQPDAAFLHRLNLALERIQPGPVNRNQHGQ